MIHFNYYSNHSIVGFIYALPLFIQILGKYIPFISNDSFPLLPIRLTESILGRITPARLAIIIPAHFLGCIVGVIMFKILIPILRLSDDVLKPITYGPNNWMFGWIYALSLESLLICIYICIVIALPVMLELNKISPLLLSLPIIPLMFFMLPDQGSTFNPAAIYALWYANGGKTLFDSELQPEHIIAPMIGSICAGIICSRYFPDDPNSWKQKQQRYR